MDPGAVVMAHETLPHVLEVDLYYMIPEDIDIAARWAQVVGELHPDARVTIQQRIGPAAPGDRWWLAVKAKRGTAGREEMQAVWRGLTRILGAIADPPSTGATHDGVE